MQTATPRHLSRVAVLAVGLASAIIALSACSSAAPVEAEPTESAALFEMSVGVLPFATLAALHLADQEGKFADSGLTIQTNEAESGSTQVAALMAGDNDVAFLNFVTAFQAFEQGLPVQIFLVNDLGNSGRSLGQGIMVPGSSSVHSPEDLAGKRIAINALGGLQELAVRILMDEAGVEQGEYELVEIPPPSMIAALEAGQADAAMIAEPFLTIGMKNNGLRQVAPAFSGDLAGVPVAGWVTTETFAQEHPEQLEAFTAVMETTLADSTEDETQQAIKDIIPTFTSITPEVANQLTYIDFDPANDLAGLEKLNEELVAWGILKAPVDLDQLILNL